MSEGGLSRLGSVRPSRGPRPRPANEKNRPAAGDSAEIPAAMTKADTPAVPESAEEHAPLERLSDIDWS